MPTKTQQAKPVLTVNVITGKENIVKAITQVTQQGKALETLLHSVSVSILYHCEKHREVSLANKLVEQTSNMVRKNALRDWFTTFGPMTYDGETKALVFSKKAKTDTQGATQKPFWDFKPEPEYKPLDLKAAIAVLVTKAETRMDNQKKGDKIDAVTLQALKKLA